MVHSRVGLHLIFLNDGGPPNVAGPGVAYPPIPYRIGECYSFTRRPVGRKL